MDKQTRNILDSVAEVMRGQKKELSGRIDAIQKKIDRDTVSEAALSMIEESKSRISLYVSETRHIKSKAKGSGANGCLTAPQIKAFGGGR